MGSEIIAVFSEIPKEFDGPEIVSFTFTPDVIDITDKEAIVTVRAHIKDESGVMDRPYVYIQHPYNVSGTQQGGTFQLESGTNKDGIYSVQVTIPQGLQPGEWEVSSNSFFDIYRNSSIWPIYPTSEKRTLTVVNTK